MASIFFNAAKCLGGALLSLIALPFVALAVPFLALYSLGGRAYDAVKELAPIYAVLRSSE